MYYKSNPGSFESLQFFTPNFVGTRNFLDLTCNTVLELSSVGIQNFLDLTLNVTPKPNSVQIKNFTNLSCNMVFSVTTEEEGEKRLGVVEELTMW